MDRSTRRRSGQTAALAATALLLAATPARAGGFELSLVERARGLDRPTAIAVPADGSGRLFLTEKPGLVRIVDAGGVRPDPFLDLTRIVLDDTLEQGLVGLAFHPAYATNGFFFVAYTDLQGNAVVARYAVSADPDVADPASALVLLRIRQPSPIHNVNQLAFGPDGYLYIASGDGGPANDPEGNAQDLALLLGKVLRIDVDGRQPPLPYAIPPDNPFVGDPEAADEIWAYGLRNPSRLSFDREAGDLWIADVGQASWEEVSLQAAASAGGENYGWNRMEGTHCFDPPVGCDDGTLTLPVLEYPHRDGDCAVIGGYRYRGTTAPTLTGIYLFGDYCSGRVRAARPSCGPGWSAAVVHDASFQISAFGEDEGGELWLVEWAQADARLFAVVAEPATELFADGFESGDLAAWSVCEEGPAERRRAPRP